MRYLILICVVFASVYFLPGVSSQTTTENNNPTDKKPVTISAKGRGFPRVGFDDGAELGNAAIQNSSSAILLTSGDFDGDGTADLMVAEANGTLKLYRGNVDSIYPNGPEAATRNAPGTPHADAFYPAEKKPSISIVPDYLEAGDFNADGFQDVLAARKGGGVIYLLPGDGAGNFGDVVQVRINGAITALKVGEIGQLDGQTDVAVAVSGESGASLLVFEHPDGAFKHQPEVIKLNRSAENLAIGNLDTDYFADIAVGQGNLLTIVRGRGQVDPWDSVEGYDIKRPAPIVETRAMSFQISALVTGYFTEKRGESLAILTSSGSIEILDSPTISKKVDINPANLKDTETGLPVNEVEKRLSTYKSFTEKFIPGEKSQKDKETEEIKQQLTVEQQTALLSGKTNLEPEANQRAIDNFLKAVSPKESEPLARWNLQTIVSADARLASAANSVLESKLVKVRVSDSGRDELAFIDAGANQIHLMIRENPKRNTSATANEIVSLDTEGSPAAILPMRLNIDALSDLVVLRANSAVPSIVMTAPTAVFTVTTAADEDDGDCGASCSLREAIDASNSTTGTNAINFNIGGGGSVVIRPASPLGGLPQIEHTVTLDGTSQPGFAGQPLIEIRGDLSGSGANGFSVNAPNVVIRGFVINQFDSIVTTEGDNGIDPGFGQIGGTGIAVYNFEGDTYTQFCIIEGNYLGTDSTGTQDRGNDQAGLLIYDSDNNTVGGSTAAARNVLSGNGDGENINSQIVGLGLRVIDGRINLIYGNYIGTSATGLTGVGNSTGLGISGMNNQIGSDQPNTGNLISGNTHRRFSNFDPQGCFGNGIGESSLISLSTGEWVTANNLYKANRVGLTANGNAPLSNCRVGLFTSPRNSATIGSVIESGRNTISGNTDGGLYCTTAPRGQGDLLVQKNLGPTIPEGFCRIIGNNVGTDVTGNFSIPNDHRRGDQIVSYNGALVVINTETLSTIGGISGTSANSCTGNCNLVSGNGLPGVYDAVPGIVTYGLGTVSIYRNFVGTNKSGTTSVSNYTGIQVGVFGGIPGGGNTNIGGLQTGTTTSSLGNLVSGNRREAIGIFDQSPDVLAIAQIRGNLIGTNASGLNAIPNCNTSTAQNPCATVGIGGTEVVIIGGANPLEGNIISGNNGTGIVFSGEVLTTPTRNNFIGVNKNGQPLGNTRDGIELRGTYDYIGEENAGNIIANNGRNGIFAVDQAGTFGNRIKYNSIYNNGALGIDLSADTTPPRDPDGVTPNDCGDVDTGPNGLQNYPLLTSAQFNGDGTVTLGGAFASLPSTAYTLDFYSNTTADPSGFGEGETYIGSASVTTDEGGIASFLWTSTGTVASNLFISGTASDIDGNTSEFSCIAGQCSLTGATIEEQTRSAIEKLAPSGGCSLAIVVNVETDAPDFNPSDGICDSDQATTGQQCSLRAAIQTAEAKEGTDFISFDIPGSGIHTISPTSDLPTITEKTLINAKTQPGHVDRPLIEVNGSLTSINSNGIVFAAGSDGSTLGGLTINRFGNAGVLIQANDVRLENNFIGVFADGIGEDPAGRQRRGVKITGANNTIGGTRSDPETSVGGNNVIVGNSVEQIWINGAAATGNKVFGNAIGFTLADDPRNRIEEADGIRIDAGASGNRIGGSDILERNVIQGLFGIWIRNSNDNLITNNGIGNSNIGIAIADSANNTIGGTRRFEDGIFVRNLLANNIYGIYMSDTPTIEEAKFKRLFIPKTPQATAKDCEDFTDLPEIPNDNPDDLAGGTITTRNNKVMGNLIGIRNNDDPREDYSNCVGVVMHIAEENTVGGDEGQFLNFISGNMIGGVGISPRATNNTVQRNYIGTDRTGLVPFPNLSGVILRGSNNRIYNNVIAGNSEAGVLINQQDPDDPFPTGNEITDNSVGVSQSNDTMVPNQTGIYVEGISNIISGNTVSGNTLTGIYVLQDGNTISNNLIGTDRLGNDVRPNTEFGMLITSSNNNIFDNLVSGNGSGITISRAPETPNVPADNNRLERNYIGTNSAGTAALPGQQLGIVIVNGAANNIIGGTGTNVKNVISGNMGAGIFIAPGTAVGATAPSFNKIQGNYIGTNASGTAAIPNGFDGIQLAGASQTLIGGFGDDMPAARNVISGNGRDGIRLQQGALLNRISGNYIGTQPDGTSPLGNVGAGIFIGTTTTGTIVGGPEPNAGNTIAYNGSNGISLRSDAGNNNIIDPNSIFGNTGLGIDLGDDGHTPNDPLDADTGPNNLQNYPEIVSKEIVNDDLIIGFKVDSAPENSAYGTNGIYIEFFKADASGEGEKFIGFAYYTLADYSGSLAGTKTVNLGNVNALGIMPTDPITATATDANGNTSEFTPVLAPTAANISVSGRVMKPNGTGLGRATVRLTDSDGGIRTSRTNSFGNFRFDDIEAGRYYVVSVSAKQYVFAPQVIQADDTIENLVFIPESSLLGGVWNLGQAANESTCCEDGFGAKIHVPLSSFW